MTNFLLKYRKPIFWVMVVLIVPGFVFVGIASTLSTDKSANVAGHIGRKKVSTSNFIQQYQSLRRQLLYLSGLKSEDIANQVNLEELTWDRILLLEHAKRKKIRVKDQAVVSWLSEQEAFSPEGVFDQNLYNLFVERQLRITPRRFEEDLRDMLVIQKVLQTMRSSDPITDEAVRRAFVRRFAPRDLAYLVITRDQLTETIEISDKEIETFYNGLKDSLVSPASVDVRYAQITDETAAENFLATLEAKGSIPVSTEHSDGVSIEVVTQLNQKGSIPGLGFSDEMTSSIFALETAGDTSDWFEHENGRVKFELIAKHAEEPIPYEEAIGMIESQLNDHKAGLALYEIASKHRDEIETKGLETFAEELNLEVQRGAGYQPGSYLDKLGMIPLFDMQADELAVGDISQPVKVKDGYALIQITKFDDEFNEGWEEKKDVLKKQLGSQASLDSYQSKLAELKSDLEINVETMDALFP